MHEGQTHREQETTDFETELREKIHQLELATVESVFGVNRSQPAFEFHVGGRRSMAELASWLLTFSGSPNRQPLLKLPWKELFDIQKFESQWSRHPTKGRFMKIILTQHPEWLAYLATFGETGADLDQWLRREPTAFPALRSTFDAYENFSQNLTTKTETFFQPGRSPANQYMEKNLKYVTGERMFYQMKGEAQGENRNLTKPTREIYWQKIEEAVSQHDTEMLDRLSQEMSEQTTIFNKLFSATVRSEYNITLEDLKDVEVEEQVASLAPEDRADMERMVTENWSSHPELIADMMDSLNTPKAGSTFYLLKKEGRVIAFLRASDYKNKKEGGLWLGMLNVDSRYKGHAIATAFTKEMVDLLGEDQILFADVFPTVDAGTMYVGRLGFQIVGISDPKKTGDPIKQRLLLRRSMDGDEESEQVTRTQKKAFRIPEDSALMIRVVDKLTAEGKIGTRYEMDPRDPKVRWITFTKFAEQEGEEQADLKLAA